MKPDPRSAAEIFGRALEFKPEQRSVFLAGACGNDVNLRKRVEALLAAHEQQSGFLPDHDTAEEIAAPDGGTAGPRPEPQTVVSPTTEGPGTVIGRYKLLEKLGEGGFGSVWAAEQREPVKRRVALKIIKLGMDTRQVVARFEAERQALALMDHPNIAKVLDAGATERPLTPTLSPGGGEGVMGAGRPYFVMELVKGIPITKYCDQEQLGTKERLDLFIKVCHAIQHAHQKGIIHRDIKPSNILVTLHDGVPVPKVIDFGIAKATQQELTELTIYTQHHQFIGTPAYMSPEQAEMSGLDIDTRSDIYSLGVLLYELLTGTTPFDTKELMQSGIDEMRRIIREREPVRPSTRVSQELLTRSGNQLPRPARHERGEGGGRGGASSPRPSPPFDGGEGEVSADSRRRLRELRGDLDWIVMKCLEKDRTRRYETANGLATDIQRHLKNEPVTARAPSAGYRIQKAIRRNKLAFVAGAAVILALGVGLGAALWMFAREHAALRQTAEARVAEARSLATAQDALKRETHERQRAEEQKRKARANAYAADMALAGQSLREKNFDRVMQLLNGHRPEGSESDLRHWEWRFLWSQCRSEATYELEPLSRPAITLAVSADGKLVAASDNRGHIALWDLRTKMKLPGLSAATSGNQALALAPSGRWLAFAEAEPGPVEAQGAAPPKASSKAVLIWDLLNARPAMRLPHDQEVAWICFSSDESRLATLDRAGTASVWDVRSGTRPWAVAANEAEEVRGLFDGLVTFSPAGRTLAVGNARGLIRILDVDSGAEHIAWPAFHSQIIALSFSSDGRHLAVGSGFAESRIRVFNVIDGRLVTELHGHGSWISALAYSADGESLLSASGDQTLRVWDTATWKERLLLRGHRDELYGMALSGDGMTVITGGKDGKILGWDLRRKQSRAAYDLLPEPVHSAAFSERGDSIFTVGVDGRLSRWDIQTLTKAAQQTIPGVSSVIHQQSLDGRWVAVGTQLGRVAILEATDLRPVVELTGHVGEAVPVGFIEKGRALVTAGGDLSVRLWELPSGRLRASWSMPRGYTYSITPDERALVVGDNTGFLGWYDLGTGKVLAGSEAHLQGITSVAVSLITNIAVVVSSDATASLWNTEKREQATRFRVSLTGVVGAGLSPDSRRLGIASETLKLWDMETLRELLTLPSAEGRFHSVEMSRDQRTLVGLNDRQQLHIWRTPSWEEIDAAEAQEKAHGKQP